VRSQLKATVYTASEASTDKESKPRSERLRQIFNVGTATALAIEWSGFGGNSCSAVSYQYIVDAKHELVMRPAGRTRRTCLSRRVARGVLGREIR